MNKAKILLGLLLITLIACEPKNEIILVSNGQSHYEIVISSEASDSEQHGAEQLQLYMERISAVRIPVVSTNSLNTGMNHIFIGRAHISELTPHEIIIRSDENDLIIKGGSDESTVFAIYEFLENYLECRWYAPDVEYVPNKKGITLNTPIDFSYIPEITTRTVHSKLFYQYPEFADKHKVSTLAFPHYVPKARVHTFHRFIPEENFYSLHPEYYALRGEKRLPTQLCLTNPDVFEIVKDSVQSYFYQYPEASVISVSQDDNQQYCLCENCERINNEEGSPAGSVIRFVNKIADYFPDKTISTLAYQYTRSPSITKPAKNVLITLCSIECDRSGSILEKCEAFANDLEGWSQLTDNVRIWDYTTQFTNFLSPFPNLHTLQPNIQLFRDNNAKWIFEQHSHNPSELFELRSYITSKLLWNPDRDVDQLMDEFLNGYYEEGGKYIRKYIDLIHEKIQDDSDFFLFLYGDPSQAFSSYLNPELLQTYNRYFDEAEEAVRQNSDVLQRVKTARLGVDYATLEACRKNISPEYTLVNTLVDGQKIVNMLAVNRLNNFKSTTTQAEIKLMNEMGFTVDEYVTNFKNALVVATKPNKASGMPVKLLTSAKKYAKEDPQTLTDGALGGASFYANWLGFEGNHMEAIIDLGKTQLVSSISTAFLQVTNHIVFFPTSVTYSYSEDNLVFNKIDSIDNKSPLMKKSKVNDIQYFNSKFKPKKVRYIKIEARNVLEAPYWHHGAGLPAWIFADEVIVD
ncbi:MAG: DUF4838 domain-containing protein [Candidatus Marinimicrobia bacterium]|jgi:hypothetical protein|nr:DUF4838 domain-containing protein [Candidatus Neomarinimicrobiota bacterium]MBT4270792.1 DUF4838 domain-containing protein [Candidatus Neomarinimicrobiota bacterium]MBT5176821.1 DUF4838 domain-containing protein [Candidatus Neomarinimicrobiota bacterium]MBT6130591.1 DUF4838 domain-containing protein [Candidatus Neomarinimicrobiota bacterium]MBT7495932.1 DUF4838 domain-containing protein [Candidatus Neomarinimicrobiota bacterium]